MLDGVMRRVLDPPLARAGAMLAARGVSADGLTALALATGLACAGCIAAGADGPALLLLLVSRALDGLDGAVARASRRTDRGGYMDIVFDFAFYGAVPFAFALRDPAANALPAAFLLLSFYVNGASFLAFAALAAKRRLEGEARGPKSIFFTAGLAEGTETILFFLAIVLVPAWFPPLAYGFGLLTFLSAGARIALAWETFRPNGEAQE